MIVRRVLLLAGVGDDGLNVGIDRAILTGVVFDDELYRLAFET